MITPTPPNNLGAESEILRALIFDNAAIVQVADKIGPDDFYDTRHKYIFGTMLGLAGAKRKFNGVILAAELAKDGNLDGAGGENYVHGLSDGITSALVQQHVEIIQEKSRQRRALAAAQNIEAAIADGKSLSEISADVKTLTAASEGANLATGETAIVRDLATVKPRPVTWIWPQRIPAAKLTLLIGHPGQGKSVLTLDIAARLSTGQPWPDGNTKFDPGRVILLSGEDEAEDTLVPRLMAAGADLKRLRILDAVQFRDPRTKEIKVELPQLDKHISIIGQAVRDFGANLLVIDPISSFIGELDDHRNSELREMLSVLAGMARDTGCAVLCVSHLRKSGGLAVHQAVGSLAYTAAARAVWALVRDPQNPERRLLLPVKMNLARDVTGLAFTLAGDFWVSDGCPHLSWESDPVKMTADDVLNPEGKRPGPLPVKADEAKEWLSIALRNGPRLAQELIDAAKRENIPEVTLKRAKDELGINVTKAGYQGPWVWSMPGCPTKETPKGIIPSTQNNLIPFEET